MNITRPRLQNQSGKILRETLVTLVNEIFQRQTRQENFRDYEKVTINKKGKEYQALNAEIKNKCKQDKEEWHSLKTEWNKKCEQHKCNKNAQQNKRIYMKKKIKEHNRKRKNTPNVWKLFKMQERNLQPFKIQKAKALGLYSHYSKEIEESINGGI